jgi:prepilin-type N-terminal cleavage/methylation domain-containing protein
MKTEKGYTLLEIAVALTIIGILVAISLASVLPMAMTRKLNEFKLAADTAKSWVDAFAVSHRRLPTVKEFETAFPRDKEASLLLEYKANPNIAPFNLQEIFQGYKMDRKDPKNFIYQNPADDSKAAKDASAPPVDYAYAIDASFPDEKKISYRQVMRYYPFIRLIGIVKQENSARILTPSFPKARRLERYNATLRISGGVVNPLNDPAKDCNLGRNLEIAVGIRAPELWYANFGSESGFNTWNTLKNLTAAFRGQPGIFEIGTDCGVGVGNNSYGRVCDPQTFEVKKMPAANQWTKLACQPNSTDYTFKIASSAIIPPYLQNYNWKFPQMGKGRGAGGELPNKCAYNMTGTAGYLPDSCIGNAYVGEYFFLVIFVKDNNDLDENNKPKIISKTYRIDMYPLRGSDPAR